MARRPRRLRPTMLAWCMDAVASWSSALERRGERYWESLGVSHLHLGCTAEGSNQDHGLGGGRRYRRHHGTLRTKCSQPSQACRDEGDEASQRSASGQRQVGIIRGAVQGELQTRAPQVCKRATTPGEGAFRGPGASRGGASCNQTGNRPRAVPSCPRRPFLSFGRADFRRVVQGRRQHISTGAQPCLCGSYKDTKTWYGSSCNDPYSSAKASGNPDTYMEEDDELFTEAAPVDPYHEMATPQAGQTASAGPPPPGLSPVGAGQHPKPPSGARRGVKDMTKTTAPTEPLRGPGLQSKLEHKRSAMLPFGGVHSEHGPAAETTQTEDARPEGIAPVFLDDDHPNLTASPGLGRLDG